ncbi:MAG: macro domain-containing protein [Candidatus Cloacimonetes bacterium]|nr:macro domain-containing protein [Candidatus Cloacimonadota bacterium]
MTKVLIGDLFESKKKVLVNTVNCVGIMGKGIAKIFKKKFPDMFYDYKNRCQEKKVKIGEPYFFSGKNLFSKIEIINFPTKNHWRSPSKLSDVILGLDNFISHYKEWKISSIAFPPLGCGNGGLEWSVVGKIMYQKLSELDIDIEIYAPYGTPKKQLTKEFLSQHQSDIDVQIFGEQQKQIKPEWIPLIECVFNLQSAPYSPKVGRVIFQKIAYVMTEMGIQTGFNFKQGTYGPYAPELKQAMHILSNSNIIKEEKLGQMTHLIINDDYEKLRLKFKSIIKQNRKKIEKTSDLFQRIKNTDKAEEMTTVFYSIRKLKQEKNEISEKELLDYVLSWKKHWNNLEKQLSLTSTIRNLVILKWLNVTYSKNMPDMEFL